MIPGTATRLMLPLLVLLICAGSALAADPRQTPEQPAPKLVLDLTVSLEWQPGTADSLPTDLKLAQCDSADAQQSYLDDLAAGLRATSAYLYSYSEGQMALGRVTIATGGAGWDTADLRVLADSSHRPSAFVGGIVERPLAYAGSSPLAFYPATIFLGRLWDGRGARCGAWSGPAGWRTIGHEWAHYALFLYDEYFNVETGAEQYCTTTGFDPYAPPAKLGVLADSLMAYHYGTDKLWLSGMPAPCVGTPQEHAHGESDWATIKRFYPQLDLPGALRGDLDFDSSPAAGLFSTTVIAPSAPPADTSAELRVADLDRPRLVAQTYLLRMDGQGLPQRIIGQGTVVPGDPAALPFWGVQADTQDRAAVLIQDWRTGERMFFPQDVTKAPPLDVADPNLIYTSASRWRPSMTVTPRLTPAGPVSEVTGLTVELRDCAGAAKRVLISYCPAGGDCGAPALVSPSGGVFTHTFAFPLDGVYEPPALRGYIYARSLEESAEESAQEETVAWYQLAGGVGPATTEAHAPLVDGEIAVAPAPGAPPVGADSRLLYGPASSCTADFQMPPKVGGIVGTPVSLQPVVASDNGGVAWGSLPDAPPLRVTLRYDQELLDRLGIGERQLVVLRLDKDLRTWQALPTLGSSAALDWITAEAQPFGGQGEVYALGYGPALLSLPVVLR